MKWVKASENPKETGNYLVLNPNGYGKDKRDVARFDSYNESWFQGSDCIHPSHWMPLPQVPEKDFDEEPEQEQDMEEQLREYSSNRIKEAPKVAVYHKVEQEGLKDGGHYYPLFKFFSDEHNLTLTDGEIQDIIYAVEQFNKSQEQESDIDKAADEYGDGFETGEFFARIRRESFRTGAEWQRQQPQPNSLDACRFLNWANDFGWRFEYRDGYGAGWVDCEKFNRKPLTTEELYNGPYRDYLKSLNEKQD